MDFRDLQNQAGGNLDEMMAKLLLDISMYIKGDSEMDEVRFKESVEQYGALRSDNYRQYLATKDGNEIIENILDVAKDLREKEVDLSPVLEALSQVSGTLSQIREEERKESEEEKGDEVVERNLKSERHQQLLNSLESLKEEYPNLVTVLENIHEATLENKPQEVDTKGVIESQEKGFQKMVEILSGILAEVSLSEKEIEVKEPKWYKPFTWEGIEPIKKILEKIASKSDLPIKNGRILVEVDRVGSGGGVIKQVGLTNETGNRINPATEETLQAVLSASGGSSSYATRFDDAGSLISYIGKAAIASATSSAVWQIQKMDETGGDVVITWADGDDSFNNIWDNRASLSYS